MADFPSYAYGTVTVAANGTVVTGTDTLWSGVNARAGDDITIAGHTVIVVDVTDETHLVIDAWPFDAVTDGEYKITQRSPLRFVGAEARADVTRLLSVLESKGLVWTLDAIYASPNDLKPVPSAAEGQLFYQSSTGKFWEMQSGSWTLIASPYGLQAGNALSEIADIGKQTDARANLDMAAFGPNGVFVASGTDPDTLTKNGVYAGTWTNTPTGNGSTIWVQILASDYAYQRLHDHGTSFVWERWKYAGTWLSWLVVTSNISPLGVVRRQIFTSSGTYTPHSKMLFGIAEGIGGGASGGGALSNGTNGVGGGGGGGGGYACLRFTKADIGASKAATIGAGGTPAAGHGVSGGDTSLGSILVAKGGLYGHYNDGGAAGLGYYGQPGLGGAGGTGDFTVPGIAGSQGALYVSTTGIIALWGGKGGSSRMGAGGDERFTGYSPVSGGDGVGYGGGGAGAAAMAYSSGTTVKPGGAGASGILIITELCSS